MRRMPRPTSLTSYLKRVRWLWLTLRRIEKHSLRLRTKSRQLWTTLFSRIWLTWVGTLSSCTQLLWPRHRNCNRIMMFSRNRWLQTPLTGRKKWSTWFLHWRSTWIQLFQSIQAMWNSTCLSSCRSANTYCRLICVLNKLLYKSLQQCSNVSRKVLIMVNFYRTFCAASSLRFISTGTTLSQRWSPPQSWSVCILSSAFLWSLTRVPSWLRLVTLFRRTSSSWCSRVRVKRSNTWLSRLVIRSTVSSPMPRCLQSTPKSSQQRQRLSLFARWLSQFPRCRKPLDSRLQPQSAKAPKRC